MPQSRRQSPCSLTPAEALGLPPEGLVLLGQQLLLLPPGQPPLHGQQLQALGDGSQAASGLLLDLQLQGLDRLCHVRPAQGSLQGVLRRGAHGTSREHGLGQRLATGVCWRPRPPAGRADGAVPSGPPGSDPQTGTPSSLVGTRRGCCWRTGAGCSVHTGCPTEARSSGEESACACPGSQSSPSPAGPLRRKSHGSWLPSRRGPECWRFS